MPALEKAKHTLACYEPVFMVLLGSGFSGQFPRTQVCFLQVIALPIIHLNL